MTVIADVDGMLTSMFTLSDGRETMSANSWSHESVGKTTPLTPSAKTGTLEDDRLAIELDVLALDDEEVGF
jgi:hypothetical protein